MNRTKEAITQISIDAGDKTGSKIFTPQAGTVIGCVIYHNAGANEFVNAQIKDSDGNQISKFQHIDNYRSRNANYADGCKPLYVETQGKDFQFEIEHTDPAGFAADFTAQLIFIYRDDRLC